MKAACIISIGTELTLGQTVDTNAAWLAARLAAIGIRAARHITVADDLEAIRDVLREAAGHGDIVLVTGGLGPTADDLTREAVAAAIGQPLEPHAPSAQQIRAFFAARGCEMPDTNRRQALLPRGAAAIENPSGTAPGIAVHIGGKRSYFMPGVPYEMRRMFERDVEPALRSEANGRVIVTRTLRCIGVGESNIGAKLRDLMTRGRNPEIGTTAEMGVIGVRINASADSAEVAEALAAKDETEISARLGDCVFGREDETLAAVVGRMLRTRQETVATAESCTGGLIGTLVTDVAGSSDYYIGGVVSYSDESKTRLVGVDSALLRSDGAVSESTARGMADGVRNALGADWGLSTTGIAGPGGGSSEKPVGLVYLALACGSDVVVRRLLLGGEGPRDVIRYRASLAALNLLRKTLVESS